MTWRELQEAVANEAARLGVSLDDVEVWAGRIPRNVGDVRADLRRGGDTYPHIELLS